MKNLFVAISDIHISLKNLDVSLQVLEQSLKKSRELKIPLVIAGDLNDTKAVMRAEWVTALIELFIDFEDVTIHIIDGNHDLCNKASSQSSLDFLSLLKNVFLYHDIVHITFEGVEFGLIPYQNTSKDFLHCLEQMRIRGIKNLICHQGFMGAFLGDYVVDTSSIDPEELKDFTAVLSGHYHKHQHVGKNIMYFGSPFTVNFGESNQEKFIWLIEGDKGGINPKPILTNVRRHHQMVLEPGYESQNAPVFWDNMTDKDLLKVVMKGPKEFALSKPKLDHKNVTLVPDIIRQSEKRIDQEIVHKPVQVIDSYLSTASTQHNKNLLRDHLFSIVQEVLNGLSNGINKTYKVVEIEANNFLSYEKLLYNFESKGLTLIEGHDEDHDISTGAGKSSFLDVVCYGLFGKTSKDLKADEVINRKNKKNLKVNITLRSGDGQLVVTRYRKDKEFDNDLYFSYDSNAEVRGKDNRETQSLLERELGLDFDMFLRSSYFTQFGSIDKFLSSSDTEKKKIISEICDTGVYDDMVVLVKDNIKVLKDTLESIEKEAIFEESQLQLTNNNVKDLLSKSEVFEHNKKAHINDLTTKAKAWLREKEESIKDLQEKSEAFETNKKNILNNLEVEKKNWDDTEVIRIQKLKNEIEFREKDIEVLEDKTKVPDKPDFEVQLKVVNDKLEIIKKLESESIKSEVAIRNNEDKIRDLELKIQNAKNKDIETNCDSCFQPISSDAINKQVIKYGEEIEHLKECNVINRGAKRDIDASISLKPELEEKRLNIAVEEANYNNKLKEILKIQDDIKFKNLEIENLQISIKERPVNPNIALIESTEKQLNVYTAQISTKVQENNPYMDKIKEEKERENHYIPLKLQAEALASDLGKKIVAIKTRQEEASTRLDYSLWWKDALHIYIKSYLTDSFIEQINNLANQKLIQMFDGILSLHISATSDTKKGSKEKITLTIFNKNEECSYNSLSGGERCRICFALNLAIAEVTGFNFGFLMFDEVLNGLDDVGKNQVMRVFKDLESQYESVFVIDHTSEFKSLFTNNIMVRKSNGVSSIVQ